MIAAIGSDSTRPVVWGVGATTEAASRRLDDSIFTAVIMPHRLA